MVEFATTVNIRVTRGNEMKKRSSNVLIQVELSALLAGRLARGIDWQSRVHVQHECPVWIDMRE
jgi:hypothetical protein